MDKHLCMHSCGFVVVNTHVHAYVLAKPVLLFYAYICSHAYDLPVHENEFKFKVYMHTC